MLIDKDSVEVDFQNALMQLMDEAVSKYGPIFPGVAMTCVRLADGSLSVHVIVSIDDDKIHLIKK